MRVDHGLPRRHGEVKVSVGATEDGRVGGGVGRVPPGPSEALYKFVQTPHPQPCLASTTPGRLP